MTEAAKAINKFLSGFGIPAYDENRVPEDAVFPYLTFTPVTTPWDSFGALMQVRVWDYPGPDFSAARIYGVVDQISEAVGEGIQLDSGPGKFIILYKGTPWAQPQPTPEIKATVVILNFEVTTFI